jgi:hypothetical protein
MNGRSYRLEKGSFVLVRYVADFELSWRPTTGKPILLGYFATEASALERLQSPETGPARRGIALEVPEKCARIDTWAWGEVDPMSGGFRVPRASRMHGEGHKQNPPP